MEKSDLPMETRMALAESWIETHDKACAARWSELKRLLLTVGGGGMAVLIGVTAWGLNKTWDAQAHQTQLLQDLLTQRAIHAPASP